MTPRIAAAAAAAHTDAMADDAPGTIVSPRRDGAGAAVRVRATTTTTTRRDATRRDAIDRDEDEPDDGLTDDRCLS